MFDQERATENAYLPPWVRHEHLARYRFAATFVSGHKVVDAACGDGTGSSYFASAGALRVDAFDVSPAAVEGARSRHQLTNLKFHVGSALALPLAEGVADVFISLETIEHIDDDRAFLAEVWRVLRPGGTFICSTPNRDVTNPGRSLLDRPWNRFHVREYALVEFRDLLAERFVVLEMLGQNPTPDFRVEAMRALGGLLPGNLPVRVNQIFKLARFVHHRLEQHDVKPIPAGYQSEYCVAVCRRPEG